MKEITNHEANRFIGRAGELQIASQLMLRRMNCAFPEVDTGYDLKAENGCRIQVKSAHISQSKNSKEAYDEPVYMFHFQRDTAIATGRKNLTIRPKKMFVDYCDVVVFWGIEQNRFWISPAKTVGDIQILALGPSNSRTYGKDLKDMREMQELGFSTYDIAQYYGISQAQAWRRLKTEEVKFKTTTAAIRACENAWEHILDFGLEKFSEPVMTEVLEAVNGEQLE